MRPDPRWRARMTSPRSSSLKARHHFASCGPAGLARCWHEKGNPMLEVILAVAIIALAVGGLGLGLLLGRGPVLTTCSAAANRPRDAAQTAPCAGASGGKI